MAKCCSAPMVCHAAAIARCGAGRLRRDHRRRCAVVLRRPRCAQAQAQPVPAARPTMGAGDAAPPRTVPSRRPSRPSSESQWSGEDGASGHPTMRASAIRAAARDFQNCLGRLYPLAAKRGVSRATFDRHVWSSDARPAADGPDGFAAGVHPGDLGLSRHPGEREAHRRWAGQARQEHSDVFDAVERPMASIATRSRRSGASRPTTARSPATAPVLRSTATLACVGRRQSYFRDEFVADARNPAPQRRAGGAI